MRAPQAEEGETGVHHETGQCKKACRLWKSAGLWAEPMERGRVPYTQPQPWGEEGCTADGGCRDVPVFRRSAPPQRPVERYRHNQRHHCIAPREKMNRTQCSTSDERFALAHTHSGGGEPQGSIRRGRGGVWDPKVCVPEWPNKIFSIVSFVFPTVVTSVWGGGGGQAGGGGIGTRPWWLALLGCGGAYWPLVLEPSAMTSRHPHYCGHPQ